MNVFGTAFASNYNAAASNGDGNWDTLLNQWWTNTNCDTPARVPIHGDDVMTDGSFSTGPATLVTFNSYDNSVSPGGDATTYNNVAIISSLNLGAFASWYTDIPATASFTFGGQASNFGNIFGNGVFINANNYSGNILNAVVDFQTGLNGGSITNSKVSFDFPSLSIGGNIVGTNSVMSYDGGSTWMVDASLLPAANKVATGSNTYDLGGNVVHGTVSHIGISLAYSLS